MSNSAPPTTDALPQSIPLAGSALVLLTVGLALGTFMEVLDTSIANVAIPTIAGNLGVATSQGTWVISSYSVASAIAVPLTGWLARRVGEVKLFTLSVILFTLTSALCGLARNFETLIVFRLLQGFVSGPMVPLSQTILLRSYPPDKRGLALGLWAMTVIVAPIFGPLLGGWLTDHYSWPWLFYINVPIGLFSALSCFVLLRGRETKLVKQRIDAVGLALLVIGVGCLQTVLDIGKDHDWFSSSLIVTLAIIAAIALSFMLIWEITEKDPVIDFSLFKDRNFALGVIIVSFGFMTFFSSVVIFPLWLQTVMGYTASLAGLATAPIGLLALVLSPLIGRNLHKLNLRLVASFAFMVFAGVSYWNSLFTLDTPFNIVILPRLVQGLGIACFFVPLTTITLSSITEDRLASAAGLSNFFRTLAGAIGTAVSTTFWENDAIYHHAVLSESVSVYSANTLAFMDTLASLGITGSAAYASLDKIITQQAYMMATNDFFRISCVVFIALTALIWWTKPKPGAVASSGH
ncbi:DHA2 family efflux MFS transporter permease subunit [Mycoavidus sp. B2-EB]|uniref:DHA2 family efflux MFS transporter permease subunit n=1 Tax=Mycoavidus sp. B2-EB TaxID=2651972 RepID=UPI0016255294|nr:DHA2 family efflux MFS transporter permease subunit [Mycoavidus sp. B2-EB]BBO58961.1 MFS transporter [Mycoavidus sp. B2-EB]